MKTICFRNDPEQDLLESCNLQVLLHLNGQVHSDHPLVKYKEFLLPLHLPQVYVKNLHTNDMLGFIYIEYSVYMYNYIFPLYNYWI